MKVIFLTLQPRWHSGFVIAALKGLAMGFVDALVNSLLSRYYICTVTMKCHITPDVASLIGVGHNLDSTSNYTTTHVDEIHQQP